MQKSKREIKMKPCLSVLFKLPIVNLRCLAHSIPYDCERDVALQAKFRCAVPSLCNYIMTVLHIGTSLGMQSSEPCKDSGPWRLMYVHEEHRFIAMGLAKL